MENIVTELCPHCETEIEMSWDVKALATNGHAILDNAVELVNARV